MKAKASWYYWTNNNRKGFRVHFFVSPTLVISYMWWNDVYVHFYLVVWLAMTFPGELLHRYFWLLVSLFFLIDKFHASAQASAVQPLGSKDFCKFWDSCRKSSCQTHSRVMPLGLSTGLSRKCFAFWWSGTVCTTTSSDGVISHRSTGSSIV